MSIFKDTFPEEIKKQIERRQDLLDERKPKHLSYLNSRKAWIRLTSGVNTINDTTPSGSNTLARQYVLQGGTLYDDTILANTSSYGGTFRQGVGSDSNKAYSTKTPSGKTHDLGIRPMPGITNVDIKSKSAYGSLREATVNFVCWDIKQLEDLELLYMRPGFTLLLEWGWSPYINNDDSYTTTVSTYDDFLLGKLPTGDNALQDIYKYLHVTKSLKESNGNYDAMIGYVKNFQWSFRSDGGYDCQTTIISFGEVLESLKINYSVLNISYNEKLEGFLGVGSSISDTATKEILGWKNNFQKVYDKGKLTGILYELSTYLALKLKDRNPKPEDSPGVDYRNSSVGEGLYNLFALDLGVQSQNQSTSDKNNVITLPSEDKYQYYITLGSLCDLLNKYILLSSEKGGITAVSTKNREYIKTKTLPPTSNPPQKSLPPPPPQQPPPPTNLFAKIGNFISSAAGSIGSAIESTTQAVADFANKIDPNSIDKLNSTSLFCLTHPLQISVDPSICLINSPVWRNGFSFPKINENANEDTPGTVNTNRQRGEGDIALSDTAKNLMQKIINFAIDDYPSITNPEFKGVYTGISNPDSQLYGEIFLYLDNASDKRKALQELVIQFEILRKGRTPLTSGSSVIIADGLVSDKTNKKWSGTIQNAYTFPSLNTFFKISFPEKIFLGRQIGQNPFLNWNKIFDVLAVSDPNLDKNSSTRKEFENLINTVEFTNTAKTIQETEEVNNASENASEGSKTNLKFLGDLLPFFKDDDPYKGLGYISNIYININYLYQLSLNQNLESSDKKEKNEINLYDYLKTIVGAVQTSIGNINNFDIHVDPIDNIGRVIDINFTEENPSKYLPSKTTPEKENENITIIEIQGTKTTATNVSLQSQIFPEQSSIVAISAQNGGGTLGLDNTTLVGFNQGIRDRILPEKYAPKIGIIPSNDPTVQLRNLRSSIGSLGIYFSDFRSLYSNNVYVNPKQSSYNLSNASEYKNALKDIINTVKAIFDDPNEFKSIIPTKLSITMDGLGGIVIGNLFKIPENRLPIGYKNPEGKNIGRKLGYVVTGLSHRIDTRFWETTIDAQTIILEKNSTKEGFNYKDIVIPDPTNPGGFRLNVEKVSIKPSNSEITVSSPSSIDNEIYRAILKGIGASPTTENIKFLYAWRQAEGGSAAWNPFNTTWGSGYTTTSYNCNGGFPVKNYASKEDGINATIKSLKQNYYSKIRNGLINNEGAEKLSTYLDELSVWGTGIGVNRILAGTQLKPPPISQSTTQIKQC